MCGKIWICELTVFTSLDIQNIATDTISCLGVGQDLDAIIGELLQAFECRLLLGGRDVLHFPPFWETNRTDRGVGINITSQSCFHIDILPPVSDQI